MASHPGNENVHFRTIPQTISILESIVVRFQFFMTKRYIKNPSPFPSRKLLRETTEGGLLEATCVSSWLPAMKFPIPQKFSG
jgi:hypothetical protein